MGDDKGGGGVGAVAIIAILVLVLLVGYFLLRSGGPLRGGSKVDINVQSK